MPNDGVIFSPEFADAHSHARSGNSKTPSTPGKLAPGQLPPPNGMNLDPSYLLNHENHFDPNVRTPEELIQRGILRNKQPLQTA